MRYVVIWLVVMVSFAPAAAAQSAVVPYALTFSGTVTKGTISGVWGGMFARGAYAGGRWTLFFSGRVAVDGTYRCETGCTFDGSVDYATPTTVRLYLETLGDTDRSETVSGSLPLDLTPPTLGP